MTKITINEFTDSNSNDFYNGQYFQAAIFWGNARLQLQSYLKQLKYYDFHKIIYPDGRLALLGAGLYFPPFKQPQVDCRCLALCADILPPFGAIPGQPKPIVVDASKLSIYEPFPNECDLTPLVEFLRLGGTEHGSSPSSI